MVCREGPTLATEALLGKVRLASYCSNMVRSIHEGSMGVYGHIVQEIRFGKTQFQLLEFVHERRKAKQDAHNLARSSLIDPVGRQVWLMNPPQAFVTP
jgi:hypothetical protein